MAGDGAGFVEHGAIAIDGRAIVAVGPAAEFRAVDARRLIDASDCLILPGLIDAHIHSAATLGRGQVQEVIPGCRARTGLSCGTRVKRMRRSGRCSRWWKVSQM